MRLGKTSDDLYVIEEESMIAHVDDQKGLKAYQLSHTVQMVQYRGTEP